MENRLNSKRNLLILEDDGILREGLKAFFKEKHYKVFSAGNLADARKKLANSHFDVIILDLSLPDGNGQQLLEEYNLSRSIVIVVSADASIKSKLMLLSIGAIDYLTKPFSVLELNKRIDRLRTFLSPTKGNELAYLSKKENHIYTALQNSSPGIVDNHLLCDIVGSETAVPVTIYRINKKLKKNAVKKRIKSAYGQGYYLGKDEG